MSTPASTAIDLNTVEYLASLYSRSIGIHGEVTSLMLRHRLADMYNDFKSVEETLTRISTKPGDGPHVRTALEQLELVHQLLAYFKPTTAEVLIYSLSDVNTILRQFEELVDTLRAGVREGACQE